MKHQEAINQIDLNFNLHAKRVPQFHEQMTVFETNGISYVDSDPSCDTFNIIHVTDGRALSFESIEKPIKYFRKKSSDFCLWINLDNLNSEVSGYLEKLGLTKQNQEVGMLLRLDRYTSIAKDEYKNISVVQDLHSLSEYAMAIAENWSPPDANINRFYELTSSFYLNEEYVTLLNYKWNGKTVSTVELFETDKETIGLYGFTTLEAYRGLGIGTSLMTYSLNLAKERGYKNAVLQGTEDGLGIYTKYRFKDYTTYFEFTD